MKNARMTTWVMVILIFIVTGVSNATLTMDWVTVGDAGNVADNTGYGAVSYTYRLGKYEVTNNQYCEFLNVVAFADPYSLYHSNMGSETYGGIERSGSLGNYSYSVKAGRGNNPVNYVSWCDTIRFANWMNNGQGSSSTETGAYTITDGGADSGTVSNRNVGAQIWLSSEEEWYKAAYYKGSGTDTGYWEYATASDTCPTSEAPPGGDNSANYYANGYYAVGDHHISDVGAYTFSGSAYGTFDQNGNMFEWTETLIGDSSRRVRGGSWGHVASCLGASYDGSYCDPDYENSVIGFRIASVPEPATLLLLGLGAVMLRRTVCYCRT